MENQLLIEALKKHTESMDKHTNAVMQLVNLVSILIENELEEEQQQTQYLDGSEIK